MKVGDLVCWHDKPSLLGIVLEVSTPLKNYDIQACRVQWANGVESNHSSTWLGIVQTSENT